MQENFLEIVQLIKLSRASAVKAANAELINLHWNVGGYISKQIKKSSWGEKAIDELAFFIKTSNPELKGFSRRGLYRMKQFYETYSAAQFVSSVMTQIERPVNQDIEIMSSMMTQLEISDIRTSILTKISWTHHLILLSRTKMDEEKEFYLRMCIKERYTVRELDRQISAGLFERSMIGNKQLSPSSKHTDVLNSFKDSYVFEFLNLPEPHNENDLQKALIKQMKQFILELGKDFLFMNEEYKVQVGNRDFNIGLLFYH